jgi:hypothetical protein
MPTGAQPALYVPPRPIKRTVPAYRYFADVMITTETCVFRPAFYDVERFAQEVTDEVEIVSGRDAEGMRPTL